MSKFKFICENDDNSKIQYEYESDYLYDVVVKFEDFLKGCGFGFGKLEVSEEESELYIATPPEPVNYDLFDSMHDENVDFDAMNAMSWTANQIMQSSTHSPAEICDVCKISKNVMKDWTCYDLNCPKISRR